MQTDESQKVGQIGYFNVYHIPEEELLQISTTRDEFNMELRVPDTFDGKISDIKDDIYPKIVTEHNEWLMEN